MSSGSSPRGSIPRYGWVFAILCFAIPVVAIGGALPSALGAGAGFYCLSIARAPGRPTRTRILHCAATTLGCWLLFLGLAGGVHSLKRQPPPSGQGSLSSSLNAAQPNGASNLDALKPAAGRDGLPDEAKRREIYARATSLRKQLADARARRADLLARGLDLTVADRQVAHIEGMQEDRLEFTARFHKITREQLDAIIAEGDHERWPSD